MEPVSPVVPGLERHEITIAKNQPEYAPLNALRSNTAEGIVLTRWRLTEAERAAVAAGADIMVSQLMFGKPITPLHLQTSDQLTEPETYRVGFRLDECSHPHSSIKVNAQLVPECQECGTVFVLCAECTLQDGGNRAIYHAPPTCQT